MRLLGVRRIAGLSGRGRLKLSLSSWIGSKSRPSSNAVLPSSLATLRGAPGRRSTLTSAISSMAKSSNQSLPDLPPHRPAYMRTLSFWRLLNTSVSLRQSMVESIRNCRGAMQPLLPYAWIMKARVGSKPSVFTQHVKRYCRCGLAATSCITRAWPCSNCPKFSKRSEALPLWKTSVSGNEATPGRSWNR